MSLPRILIADDHPVVRDGLRQYIAAAGLEAEIGDAATGAETLQRAEAEPWDLLLLDLQLPDVSGLEVLKRVHDRKPSVPIVVFTMHAEAEYAATVLRSGARGYVMKDSSPAEIVLAIRRGLRGERYLGPGVSEVLISGALDGGPAPHHALSNREMEIALMLCRGLTHVRIGRLLGVSPKTVTTYRQRALDKLGLASNAELVKYMIRHGLDLEDPPLDAGWNPAQADRA